MTLVGVILLTSAAQPWCLMRILFCACTISLAAASGAANAEPEEEQTRPAQQVATPPPYKGETVVGIKKSPAPDVSSQVATRKPGSIIETPEQLRKLGAEWRKQCLQDWDAATHMTKHEWQRVCRRVAEERTNALIRQVKEQNKEQAQNQAKR